LEQVENAENVIMCCMVLGTGYATPKSFFDSTYEPRQIEIDLMAKFGHFEIFIISDGV
jgi:hypothetical protein